MKERVQKIMARAGIASRRNCEELIRAGKVTINGEVAKLGDHAHEGIDDIRVRGQRVKGPERIVYYAVNKPAGYVSTVIDPEGRPTVLELVPPGQRVYPVGRLDRDAEGLLLMTNDGPLSNTLMHPRYEIPKIYHVTLSKEIAREDIVKLKSGVKIDRRRVIPDKVSVHTPVHIEVTIHEGRKHIVKRMFRKMGYTVVRLKRTQFANISLGQLPPGGCRELKHAELMGLIRLAKERQ